MLGHYTVELFIRLKHFRLFGAPVLVHWSVVAFVGILSVFGLSSPLRALIAIVCFLSVIAIHEVGHALVAVKLGYKVKAIKLGVLHGRCEAEKPSSEWDYVLIAWGGVIAQATVAVGIFITATFVSVQNNSYFGPVIVFLGYYNLGVVALNIIPAPRLDGQIAWRIVPLFLQRVAARG